MHILFLTDNFPPEVNAPAARTHEHCRAWVDAGHRVTVVTCVPNFPGGRVFDGYSNRLAQRETVDGIDVVRVWTYITANEAFVRRTLDYASYMVAATVAGSRVRDVDVVVATSPQFFAACAGYLVAGLLGKPFVFELRDLWPESIRAVGAMGDGPALRALEKLEMFLYRRATAVVCVTESFRDNLVARGVDPGKISVVTNGVDLGRFVPAVKDAQLAAGLGLTGKFVAGYIGTLGMAHGLDTLIDAADRLRPSGGADDLRLLLVGDGAAKARLMAQAADRGVDTVRFLDPVPRAQVARYWSLLEVGIIHLKNQALFRSVIPSKLFECMAMGIPVLHGVEGESARIVETAKAGLTFEPENAGALAQGLVRLARDPALCRRLGDNGRRAARNYDRTALAASMLTALEAVAARPPGVRRAT